MSLTAGTRLGPYEILSPIGEGGMGEVWKARDTRLDRIVAVKVSKEHFSERFEREARAIAALNHPNICTLHDVGPNYLVMEYVDGTPLKGPLPLVQTLKYATQICDALDAAHKKGITHRDLKPANILVTKAGVKLLDFGLAKMGFAELAAKPPGDATLTMALTGKNEIVGTLYYMSPEQLQAQATGQGIDARSDIFSFGLVLYEMLTGKRAFEGSSPASVIAAIIERPAPSIATIAPPALERLLQRCLAKDPDDRWQSARDLKAELVWIANGSGVAASRSAALAQGSRKMIWVSAAVAVVAIASVVAWSTLRPTPDQPMFQMEITPPEGVRFDASLTPFALSPDGRKLAFLGAGNDGKTMLWLRPIDGGAAVPLAGTESASHPFWSPDSHWIGFATNGKLQKMDVTGGGPPQVICEIEGLAGGTWNSDGVIVFDQRGKPLQRISAEGGDPTPISQFEASRQEVSQAAPYFLPDGRHLVYLSGGKNGSNTALASLDGKLNRVLVEGSAIPTYAANPRGGGWMLYNLRYQLLARPFDLDKLEFIGQPTVIADGVGVARWWAASSTGLLAFRRTYGMQFQLAWFSRDGRPLGTVGDPGLLGAPRISPDQKTVAFQRTDERNTDIWTFDLARNTAARFTFEPTIEAAPVWSSDGKKILYASGNDLISLGTAERSANGVGQAAVVATGRKVPTAVSHDGRWLVLTDGGGEIPGSIVIRAREDANKAIRIQGRGTESDGSLSPDGRWLLYTSISAARREVLVQSLPEEVGGSAAAAGKWQISVAGGGQPTWRADGKEIFFVAPDGMMMSALVESGENFFRPGTPNPLFHTSLEFDQGFGVDRLGRQYDVTPDGQRFLLSQHVSNGTDAPITVVVNWPKLLEKH